MCGIVGFTKSDDRKIILALQKIIHRGPDERGVFVDDKVSLAHSRLSILDLSLAAAQPMKSADENEVLIFNGEIYNFNKLKEELIAKGYAFKSSGDTEVILYGYKEYGEEFFSKMRGMWALAIYDENKKRVVLARDYFGIKPLYYAVEHGVLFFASEVKSLMILLDNLEPNADAYYQFINLGYFVEPQTCFRIIKKMLPGEIIVWDMERRTYVKSQARLLDDDIKINYADSFEEAVEMVDLSLRESVLKHYISDVPVGLLLSGGNDSSLLAALSVAQGKRPIAYNLNIQNSSDSIYAKKVSKYLGLELVSQEMPEEILEDQYEKIWNFIDEPMADYSVIPTSLIYSCIRGKAKVVLSGEGGDELFGGYMRHLKLSRLSCVASRSRLVNIFNFLAGSSKFALKTWNPLFNRVRNLFLEHFDDDLIGSYLANTKSIDYPFEDNKIRKFLFDLYNESPSDLLKNPAGLFYDRFMYLSGDLMYKNDISSMAYSIEARVPFLDKSLFNVIIKGVNPKFCLSPKYMEKAILKKVMEKYLPKELIYRPKKGFSFSFTKYVFPSFRRDFDQAIKFHQKCAEWFGLSGSGLLNVLDEGRAELLIRKYPNLAFAIVSNWKIFKDLI